jgi:hypothetical protein
MRFFWIISILISSLVAGNNYPSKGRDLRGSGGPGIEAPAPSWEEGPMHPTPGNPTR